MRRHHTAKGARIDQLWRHIHKIPAARLRYRVAVFGFFGAGGEVCIPFIKVETRMPNDLDGFAPSEPLGYSGAFLLCQPLKRVGGGPEAGDYGDIPQPEDLPIS